METQTQYTTIAKADFDYGYAAVVSDRFSEPEQRYFVEVSDEREEFTVHSSRGNLEDTMFRFMECVKAEENRREFERNL